MPPFDAQLAILTTMLAHRSDAAALIAATADRLGVFPLPEPGPVMQSEPTATFPIRLPELERSLLCEAFDDWRAEIAGRRHRAALVAAHRAKRTLSHRQPGPTVASLASTPELTRVVKWAERDAALRSSAVSLSGSSSTASLSSLRPPPVLVLPFATAEDLPADLDAHKDRPIIVNMLKSRPDLLLSRWRRRCLYTLENYAEWTEWSQPGRPHRDRHKAGHVFLYSQRMLCAPDLRSASVEAAADAWHEYRRLLLTLFREALTLGFPWAQILQSLHITLSDPSDGYPRVVNYLAAALEDSVLLAYPLLHADVLIHKLDCSYAKGSAKYAADSITLEWEGAVTRRAGEDVTTLAIRITNAFILMHDDPATTNTSVWSTPSFVNQINRRYAMCLYNDDGHPERGPHTSRLFQQAWNRAQSAVDRGRATVMELSCEEIAEREVAPFENSGRFALIEQESEPLPAAAAPHPLLTHRSQPTGTGSRLRRDAARAAAGLYAQEPPPSTFQIDTLPGQH